MGSAVARGFGRARVGEWLVAARAVLSRPVAGREPGRARRGAHPRRRLPTLAALLLGAALAAPAWAQDIVHPRVLMDTQITVGGYRVEHLTDVDQWGYAAGPAIGGTDVVETVHDGSLEDAAFVYRGVEYTVKRLTITSNSPGEAGIEIEDADAAALPDTAAVGIELQGTGGTVLVDWRQRAEEDVDDEVKTLLAAWRDAPGTVLPVRILNLDASDVWSADLHYGTEASLTVGYGGPAATGTLTATGFVLDGVEYTVDRLTVATTTQSSFYLRFATTPDLPATAQLRLAVPRFYNIPGVYRYHALEPASVASGDPGVDYEWSWSGSMPGELADETAPVYLTRAPGETPKVSGFWDATLTPNGRGHGADLVGYRGAGLSIPGFSWESDGAGTLAPASVSLRGVDYTVEVLAIVSNTVDYLHVALRTDPLLPRGQDLWLELEHVDGSTAAFAIDTASVVAPGYQWREVYAGEDRHGWGTDGSDADMDPDSVTVRLLGPAAPVVAATVSPPSVREDAGTASLEVTVGLVDGEPALGDVPVTVTVGNADDTATATDDYAVVAPLTLTISAGQASASQSVTIDIVGDSVLEAPERVTFAVAAPGHTSGAPGELSIEDPARVEFEYWRGTLSRAAPFEVGTWTLSGYFAPLDAARGSTLTPSRLLCCGGREASPSMRSVRVLGRAKGADRRRMFVLGMNGLIRDGALAPAFAGAALRIDGRVRLLDDAELIDFAGAPALAWPWREAGLPDPAAAAFEVRLTGPDHPVLVAVEAVSSPAGGTSTDRRYAVGETIEIALRFDEPVTVTGVPTLALAIGANTRSASYAYAPGPRTLVFAYTVVAADADADGVDVGPVADAVTLGTGASIVSVRSGLDAAYGDLDPAPFANHRVDGTLTTPSAPTLSVRGATVGESDGTVTLTVALSFTRSSDVTASWATSGGTAAAGSDYTAASDSLTVTAGDRVTTVDVNVLDDTVAEGPETFAVTLSGANVALATATATVTILDDDVPDAMVRVTAPAGSAPYRFERELDGAAWTVSAAAAPVADLTVNVLVEEAGGDFVPESKQGVRRMTIPAGSTFVTLAPVVDDEVDEPHGTVTVRVLPGPGYVVDSAASAAAATVRDDDFRGAPLEFFASPATGTLVEGGALVVEQVVRTVADGTFTASGDLARVLQGLDEVRLKWGVVTHLETDAADIGLTPSEAPLAVPDFVPHAGASGGVGLIARRPLGSVTAVDDGVEEGVERVLVALKRIQGDAALLRPAAHPGADGFDVALVSSSFYRVALTVREQALALVPESAAFAEGERTTVRATMTPPRAAAFEVTLSLAATDRFDFVGTNRTLSFAAGAAESTGTVTVLGKRTPGGDGTADVLVTGTPGVADVKPAATTLRVYDADPPPGAVLWETELTLGVYTDDGGTTDVVTDNTSHYGYADTDADAVTGLTENTAGALADVTFEFQGVEYTVRRLTLGSSTEPTVADLKGEFVATDARGVPLPVGKPAIDHYGLGGDGVSPVNLALEIEGKEGVTRLRRLEPGTIGVLAAAAEWETVTLGTGVTVRLIHMGPMAWWSGRVQQAQEPTRNGYWVADGEPNGGLAPDAFELEDSNGERVLYTVDRLTVATAGGARVLRFSTEPAVPPGIASLLVSRLDYNDYDPRAALTAGPGDLPSPALTDIYHVFPLTAARRSTDAGIDYEFPLAEDTSLLSGEALHHGIERALLVPMAGAGASAPPPPAPEKVWAADVTVGEYCYDPPGAPAGSCDNYHIGVSDGRYRDPHPRYGELSDWRVPLTSQNPPSLTQLRFERDASGRTDLWFVPLLLRIERSIEFGGNLSLGLEVQGDYGTRMHWLADFTGAAPELDTVPWLNVDPGHGWDAGEAHRVRLVRPRRGARYLSVDGEARVAPDRSTVLLSLRAGYGGALPRGVDTTVRVTAEGVSEEVTIPARALQAALEMEVPMPADHGRIKVSADAVDSRLQVVTSFGNPGVRGRTALVGGIRNFSLPLIWPPTGADEIEYWSATLRARFSASGFIGFADPNWATRGVGALSQNRFACCGAPVDSATGRTVLALGSASSEVFPVAPIGRVGLLALVLEDMGEGDGLPADLRGTTLHLEQLAYQHPPVPGTVYEPLLAVQLPLADAALARVPSSGSDSALYLEWGQLSLVGDHSPVGEYRVRLTGPGNRAFLTAVELVSLPGAGTWFGNGETIAIRLRFNDPVVVLGTPTLTFEIGTGDRTAAYAYGSGSAELVFEYVVQAADSDSDGIDVAALPGALTLGDGVAIVSAANASDAVFGALDPPNWAFAKVDGTRDGVLAALMLQGATVTEGDGAARLTVVLGAEARASRTFAYETADGSAVAGEDYRSSVGTVTVPVGRRTATFEIAVFDDAEAESEEDFTAKLTRSGTTLAEAQVTVRDDDVPIVTVAAPTLAADGGYVFENETGPGAAWTLRRPASAAADALTLNLTVEESGGNFVADSHEGPRTVALPAGASSTTFTPVTDDGSDYPHGTVTVRLRAGTGYALGWPDDVAATAAVRDDDGPLVALRLDPAELAVAEGAVARVFVVAETLPDADTGKFGTFTELRDVERVLGPHYSMGYVPVNVSTPHGTATEDTDYSGTETAIDSIRLDGFRATPEGGLIQQRAGPPVATTADTDMDDGETFGIRLHELSGAAGRVVLGDPSESTVTIREGATLALEFSATDDTIAEGDDAASAGSTTVTATASVARITAWTVEISAQSADDARWEFADANRTLTFESNATTSTGTVTIRAVPNDLDEPDIELTVRGMPEASTSLPEASAILTLTDDDLPKVSIAAPPLAVETGHLFEDESDDLADGDPNKSKRWVLTRDGVLDESLTVNLSVEETGGGDFVDADKETTAQTWTFDAGSAITSYTPITVDTTHEVHGTVTVAVIAGTGYEPFPGSDSASALVRDDDGDLVSFTITPAALSVSEGQTRNLSIVSQTVQDMTFTSIGDLGRVFGGDPVAAVMLGAAPGTASEADYSVGLNPIVFNAAGYQDDGGGGLRGTAALPFSALADSEDDAGETVTVSITGVTPGVPGDTRIALGTVTASVVTILEGPALTFSVTPTDLAEGATATVTASVEPVHDATVTVTVAGTSTDDTRWEFAGATTLTFAANQAAPTGTVTVRAISNAVDDGDLDITLTGTPSVAAVTAPAPVVLTVLDDDLPQVSIAAPTGVADGFLYEFEAATDELQYKWVLTRAGLTDETLTVNLSVSETGGDFVDDAKESATQTVMFGAGDATVGYTPIAAADTTDDAHGTVTVTVQALADSYDAVSGSAAAAVAVRDDDGEVLTVSIDDVPSVAEGTAAVFDAKAANTDGTLTEARHLARLFSGLTAVSVTASTADGSATAGSDYTALTDAALSLDTFEAVSGGVRWVGEVSVDTVDDTVTEGSEDFTVTLSLAPGTDSRIALSATDATGTATIVEGPSVTLTLSEDEIREGETATVTATVDPVHDAPFTVTVAGTSTDDARWEIVGSATTLTFAANQAGSTGSVRVRAVPNDDDDGDVEVELTGMTSLAAVTAPAPVTLTVLDDDLPRVSIAAPTGAVDGFLYEFEAATDEARYRWSLTRVGLTEEALTVDLSVAETGGGDFAADGADTVTFDAGESTTSYTPITADDLDDTHGTVTVTVQSRTDSYDAVSGSAAAALAVRDDDGEVLTVSIDDVPSVAEGTAAVFGPKAANTDGTLTEAGHLARLFSGLTAVSVTASTADGSATAGSDYTALTDAALSLDTFEAVSDGVRWVGEVSVDTVGDTTTEGSEDFTVTLSLAAGTDSRIALSATDATGTATIVEGPSVTLTLSEDEIEEGETATVTATVEPVHDAPFTVTVAGTSTDDARWEIVGSGTTLTFAANQAASTGTVTIRAISNDDDDGDVEVELTATPSLAAVVASAPVTLTVLDDDLPTVSIAAPTGVADGFLYEAEAATDELQYKWVLTRDGLTDETLTVDLSVSEALGDFVDDAKEGATQPVTFAADEMTVGYTPITAEDTTNDTHGTVTVTVDAGTDYAVDAAAASAELAVRDDDGELVTVTLDPATPTVKEGLEAELEVVAVTRAGTFDTAAHMARLFGTVTQAEAIASTEASTGDSAATAGTDYTALAAETVALPFADFAGSGGVLRSRVALPGIETAEDEVDDADETFEVTLAAPADQDPRIAVSTTASTVTINEGPPDGAIRLCSGTAEDTCTDVDKALASRNTEGRVEVINNGEWGTVCDDYWSNDDGQVACKQMGFAGAERVFWNSRFGGAAKGTEMWLDNLQCVGNEKGLLDCPRRGTAVGEHDCSDRRHTEDAGVRCLAAETAAHGAKVDPLTLTIAPGGTGRYWVSLTKNPEVDVLVTPKLNTEAEAALEVTEGPLPFPKGHQWSYALDVDVTVKAGAASGTYTVTHTMDTHENDEDGSELTFTVPDLTVEVAASTSVTGPAPVSATVSGRDASVRFDAPLDASFAPSASDFAVLADGRWLAVTGAWTAGRSLLLELAEPATGAVRLAYVPSAAAPLGGRDGSAVAPFETLALGAPGELADDAPDALTPDAPKLEGAPGLEAALADALRHAPGPVAATLAAPRRAVADLSGLGAVPELRRVNLAGNAVTDAGPLALLADLERLDLSGNAVADLWPLSGLAELRVLDLSGNRVTDVTALAGLPRLRVLELSGNAVEDLSALGALPSLEYLGVAGNRVADVTALADLYALVRLDLDGNAVVDAAPLGDAGRLVWLKLSGNRLATLDGLGRLTKLRWVWVADNPLPDGAVVVWPEHAWVDRR